MPYYYHEPEVIFPSANIDPYNKITSDLDWVREDYYHTVLGKIMTTSASEQTFAAYMHSNQRRYREALDIGTRWNSSYDRYNTMLRYQQQCEERQRRLHHRATRALQDAVRAERIRRSTLVGICNELRTHPEEPAAEQQENEQTASSSDGGAVTCVPEGDSVSVNEKVDQKKQTQKKPRILSVLKRVTKKMTVTIRDSCCWHPIL
ncbi:hypothetical protein INT44_005299 [Umbelopsis vinacea]|uniref:Uncharacterized protein n=1 Tax=Umbelopsis vinacea TaxID=44442 RepID=A0A8H7ULI1_9FUNG|nr:hypothetical protein INT44_005299 [Umbelopsis vinacea]KAI9287273.1 hypothetical protein BC943DRAFT_208069 [Umbelopsis sp. AD052]